MSFEPMVQPSYSPPMLGKLLMRLELYHRCSKGHCARGFIFDLLLEPMNVQNFLLPKVYISSELPTDVIHFSSKLKSIENITEGGLSFSALSLEDGTVVQAKIVTGCTQWWRVGWDLKLRFILEKEEFIFVHSLIKAALKVISCPECRTVSGSRTVHRRTLLEALAQELNTIRFSSMLRSIRTTLTHEGSSIAVLSLEDGTIIKAKVTTGCCSDRLRWGHGVNSVVAKWLGLATPVHSGRFAVQGLSVFPQGHGLKHDVQQFVNGGIRAGFAPLNDKELYCFVTYKSTPNKGEDSLYALTRYKYFNYTIFLY
ncbi:hypothetical protein IFM89_013406 [Coptis chinensis]|uniref:Uncharacterized protein n=1 Tax=Coptis chinensis TaxID=261450 RepID=A0A835I2Z6_9MAGN|nr:hypothetical protein IFM89_013406 [Coptis chinensis]